MSVERERARSKIFTVLGAVLLLFPNGVFVFWGNISVYVLSYCVVVRDSTFGVEAPWIISTNIMFTTFGFLAYSTGRKYLGKWLVYGLGIAMVDLGFFCSYVAVQTTFMALNVTLAAMTGFGNGLLQSHALLLIVDVATDDTGLITSIVNGAFYWGACVINLLATFFVNPENKMAAATIGHAKYFTQRDVLGKVPSLFLVLGSVSVGFHLVASLLLNVDPCWSPWLPNGSDENGHRKEVKSKKNSCSNEGDYGSNEHVETKKSDLVTTDELNNDGKCLRSETGPRGESMSKKNSCDNDGDYGSNEQIETKKSDLDTIDELNNDGTCLQSIESDKTVDWSNGVELTPTEMLKTPSFYALFVTALMAEYPIIVLFNYYKSFGQIWIDGDHFLTQLGNVMIFTNIWMRILWGIALDKVGPRACFVLNIILVIFMSAWCYFSVFISKWFYATVIVLYGSLTGVFFSGIVMGVVCLYGKSHFSTNFGIVRSSAVLLNVVIPFVTDAILNNLGWYYIFGSAAILNVVSLILMLFCIPLK